MNRALRGLWLGLALCASARAEPDFDALLYRATRYGNTEQRRQEKEAARETLFALGPVALREVMARAHVENLMLHVLALELVTDRVPAESGAPVLAAFLSAPQEQTRRIAAYLLGFYPRWEPSIPALLAQLEVERERQAALRTLGKWRVAEARSPARALVCSTNERIRIVACNALGEIGDRNDLPVLIEALGDPALLVRNAAARAILAQGARAQRPLRRALAASGNLVQRRQIVRLLGALAAPARSDLKRCLRDADPGLREDAAWALRRADAPWTWEEPYF